MMYGWRKTREKGERFLRKRERDTEERVWRYRESQNPRRYCTFE